MKFVNQSVEIVGTVDGPEILKKIELCGRVCYKSEDRITEDSAYRFIKGLLKSGHLSVLEHEIITIKVITNRAVSHQLVRHRIGSYSQESQRYCNYTKAKFKDDITFVLNDDIDNNERLDIWKHHCYNTQVAYFDLIETGLNPETARGVLSNDVKTELILSKNLRAWREFLELRIKTDVDPQTRRLCYMILDILQANISVVFDDII